jgi:hypothetical protein
MMTVFEEKRDALNRVKTGIVHTLLCPLGAELCLLAPLVGCLLSSDFNPDNSSLPRVLLNREVFLRYLTHANGMLHRTPC